MPPGYVFALGVIFTVASYSTRYQISCPTIDSSPAVKLSDVSSVGHYFVDHQGVDNARLGLPTKLSIHGRDTTWRIQRMGWCTCYYSHLAWLFSSLSFAKVVGIIDVDGDIESHGNKFS